VDITSDCVIESIQEIVSKLNKAERGLFPNPVSAKTTEDTELDLQATSYSRTFGAGFHLQIPGGTTMLHANLGITEPEHGGLKVILMRSGNLLVQARSYGFMENVST